MTTNKRASVSAMCEIPLDVIPAPVLNMLKTRLTLAPVQVNSILSMGKAREPIKLYRETPHSIIIPRKFGKGFLRDRLPAVPVDEEYSNGFGVHIDFDEERQSTRPAIKRKQDHLVNAAVKGWVDGELGGNLCAPCGTGKTVVGLKAASRIGTTTLILVHKEFLLHQWIERIGEWCGIPPEDVGIVQQDRCDFRGPEITIAIVQSLVARKYPADFYQHYGLILLDEVHRHGAETWSDAIGQFHSRFRLGLTATPYRKDGMWDVIRCHIGDIIAEISGEMMKPEVYQLVFTDTYKPHQYGICSRGRVKKVFPAKLITLISENIGRNKELLKVIEKAASAGRKVLFLSDRRKHLTTIFNAYTRKYPDASVGYYVGGMKQEQREASARCQIILGTFAMAQEGLDVPDVDVLVMGTPKGDVEQAVGRILRASEDKKTPIVIDPVDNEEYYCDKLTKKRERFFASKGWKVHRRTTR